MRSDCSPYILVDQYKKGDPVTRKVIYEQYLRNTAWVNNWDLVDCSAGLPEESV